MGNQRWLKKQLQDLPLSDSSVLELGAGDGSQAKQYKKNTSLCFHGIDLSPRPASWPKNWQWTQANLLTHPWPQAQTIIGNLILHHFHAEELKQLGNMIPTETQQLFFIEPARRQLHLLQGKLLHPFISEITKHDLNLSVRAGFLPEELGSLLQLSPQKWNINEHLHPLGGLRFSAQRIS